MYWQIYPLSNGNFTDSCSDNSYFIPTLRAYHLAHQVLADLPPHQTAISQIPALLWELIFSRPPVKWQFHRFLWNSYFIPSLTAQHLADQVLADLPPSSKAISQIPALIWELIFGRPCIGRSTPCQWQFHRFLLWQLIFHSYSESSSFGRPGPDRSTSHPMVILQILALTAHYSENLSFGRPGLGRSTPPIKWQFHRFLLWQLPTLRAQHLTDQVLADLNPHIRWHFHRFLWNSYIIPTLRAQHLVNQGLGRYTAPHQMAISQIPTLLWKLIFVSPNVFWSTPHPPMVISQMLADRPPHQTAILQIPALLW